MEDLMRHSAVEQARLIREGEVSADEMVEAAITAIEKLNPDLNAVVLPMYDMARAAVSDLTGKEPLSGVPMLLKDVLAEYEGAPMTEGSRFLRGYVSARDSELVRRYRRGGLVVVGRTNAPEFASKPTTEPELYGATSNPWDKSRSPGGSSGGGGAAGAAGVVGVAPPNHRGGATRQPAGTSGRVGVKPTRRRQPQG
ncbi:MAG: amidase family protein, partial [Gammaproteobacteria bacterium]|nr:amidase family protein [Gammaproteobacteria bacterium]